MMRYSFELLLMGFILVPMLVSAQRYRGEEGNVRVAIVKNPYTGSRSGPELSEGPNILDSNVLHDRLEDLGCEIWDSVSFCIRCYGTWCCLSTACIKRLILPPNRFNFSINVSAVFSNSLWHFRIYSTHSMLSLHDECENTRKRINSALYRLRPYPSTIFADIDFEDRRS